MTFSPCQATENVGIIFLPCLYIKTNKIGFDFLRLNLIKIHKKLKTGEHGKNSQISPSIPIYLSTMKTFIFFIFISMYSLSWKWNIKIDVLKLSILKFMKNKKEKQTP